MSNVVLIIVMHIILSNSDFLIKIQNENLPVSQFNSFTEDIKFLHIDIHILLVDIDYIHISLADIDNKHIFLADIGYRTMFDTSYRYTGNTIDRVMLWSQIKLLQSNNLHNIRTFRNRPGTRLCLYSRHLPMPCWVL